MSEGKMALERCCTGMTSFARSATSGSTERQSSFGTGFVSRSCHSRLIPTFRPGAFQRDVTIQCSVGEVFRFYRDFKNLPSFLGDVMAIEHGPATSPRPAGHSSNLDDKSD